MKQFSATTLCPTEQNCAEQLARFFPRAIAVRLPVQVTALRRGPEKLRESTIVEFGTTEHVIFQSTLPLEFNDRVRIQSDVPGNVGEAAVIGVQYHDGRKAIAVRLLKAPWKWVIQP